MKARRNKIILTTALTLLCGLAMAGCEDTPNTTSVVLENFSNEERTVFLEESLDLPKTVTDTNGTEYAVTYSVVTESGKTLDTINDVYWISDMEKHYVHCQVQVAENEWYTRTITLTVKDESAPEIKFEECADGYEGENYLLPNVNVKDASKETITPTIKVYALNGEEKGEELACDGVSFTPNESGYYQIEATATDSSGNTATRTEIIHILSSAKKTALLSFESASDANKIVLTTKNSKGKVVFQNWLPEFAGVQNVVQLCYNGNTWAPQFTFDLTKTFLNSTSSTLLEDYEYAVLRLYVVKTEAYPNAWNNVKANNTSLGGVPAFNQWVDYKFSLSLLKDLEEVRIYESVNGGDTGVGMFYIGGIYAVNEATVSVAKADNSSEVVITAQDSESNALDLEKATVSVVTPEGALYTVKNGRFTPTTQGTYTIYVQMDGYWGKIEYTTE